MKFLSVCSGIEAASVAWHPLGWKAVAFSEIEPFPCSLLKHHYPDTPNWGDMNNFKEWPDVSIDLLCGGTPCQSFSVAGLRKGLDDPRGNLMLTFGAIAAKYRPKWLVWENVPGVVSSNAGQDFTSFLDMLEELGYVCDIEILDAQYFGVAQRRRRVFVCGQHRNDLLSQRTDTSALTITQCLQEILQAILTEGCSKLGNAPGSSALPMHSRDGATRRMRLFGLDGESECWPMLRENLIAASQRYQQEPKHSGALLGESEKELTQADQLTDSQAEDPFTLTEQSLKNALDEAFEVMKLFTTLMPISPITQAQIYTCSKAALLIAKLTGLLSHSSPAFWNSALSSLTAIEEYTNYARSTNSDLFGDVERVQAWSDFIEQAEHASESFLNIGIECFGEIFPLPDCLQGHPAPSRQAGQTITPTIRAGAANGGAGHGARSGDSKDELIIPVAATLSARTNGGGGLGTVFELGGGLQVVGTMKACKDSGGWSNSADHAAAGYMVPVPHAAIPPALKARDHKGVSSDGDGAILVPMIVGSLSCNTGPNGHDAGNFACNQAVDAGHVLPVPFDTTQITSAANYSNPKAGDPCHPLAAQAHVPCIAFPERMSATQCATTENLAPSMGALNPTAVALNNSACSEVNSLYNQGFNIIGDSDASTQETHSIALLRSVREAIGAQAFAQWGLGILDSLQSPEVLRSALHGSELRPAPFSRRWVVCCALGSPFSRPTGAMHSMREAAGDGCSPQGWGFSEQQFDELGAYLSKLSQPGAQAERFMRDLREASEGIGLLRSSLSAIQEARRPTGHQGQPVHANPQGGRVSQGKDVLSTGLHGEISREGLLQQTRPASGERDIGADAIDKKRGGVSPMAVRRLVVEECEFLQGFPRGYTAVPNRGKPAADGPRYKALGNSWAVPNVRWIGKRIQAVALIQQGRAAINTEFEAA